MIYILHTIDFLGFRKLERPFSGHLQMGTVTLELVMCRWDSDVELGK